MYIKIEKKISLSSNIVRWTVLGTA